MKNFFRYVLIVYLISIPVVSFAAEFRTGDQVSIKQNEKIINDVYIAGSSVTSSGVIEGDLIVAGGNVVVGGDVTGDVISGGGNVSIFSNIGDDVRVGGGTVIIQGKVVGDVMLGGGQINISGEGVGGDVAVGGGDVSINAPIAGDLYVGGGNVYINAPVGGNVKIEAEKVTLGSGAVISGSLTYKAKKELTQETGAVVVGRVSFEEMKAEKEAKIALAAIFSVAIVWKFLTLLVCALIVGLLLRRYSKEIVSIATKQPLYELGRGLVVIFVMPVVAALLMATLIGIPFGILGLIGFVALIILAWITAPIILGAVVYKYFSKRELEISWKTILLGVFLFSIIELVPLVGSLANTFLVLIALGASVMLKLKVLKEWR